MNEKPEPSEGYLAHYKAMLDDAIIVWDQVVLAVSCAVDCIVEQWQRAIFTVYLSRWLPKGPATFLARHWPRTLIPEIDLSFLDSVPDDPVD